MEELFFFLLIVFWIASGLRKFLKESTKKVAPEVKEEKGKEEEFFPFEPFEFEIKEEKENFPVSPKETFPSETIESVKEKSSSLKEEDFIEKTQKTKETEIKKIIPFSSLLEEKQKKELFNLEQLKRGIILSEIIALPLAKRKYFRKK